MAAPARRRILCVFPRYRHSFGTFDHALPLLGARAFMPPQGLLVIAAFLPAGWDVRFVDENVRPVGEDDLAWADAVLLSGMHHQRDRIDELNDRAHAHGALTVLGGPSVSACPEWYPAVDILHVGELGDATDAIVARLAADVSRPAAQEVHTTEERRDLAEFPLPAYRHLRMGDYMMGSLQFSSGCPYKCEFCDIPELYGRRARLKEPERVLAELDAMLAAGPVDAVYFVDDNFVANPRAAQRLVEALLGWQEERGFPVQFACEGTLNMAKRTDLLELMRAASFRTVFCGIETPEEDALRAMHKQQNLSTPILDAVRTLNDHGLEVVSGIILGLDSDTPSTPERILSFIEASRIPMLTINLLYALPRTPLWRRLAAEDRILAGADAEGSNVRFLLPRDQVLDGWRRCLRAAYEPCAILGRFAHQLEHTYRRRRELPARPPSLADLRRGVPILARVLWRVGVRADWRREFWRVALPALRRGQVEEVVHVALVTHHMVSFAREATSGAHAEASFYSPRVERQLEPAA
jgi:radical SAM superfamily enzyme YgiQ (UPF0313 family)